MWVGRAESAVAYTRLCDVDAEVVVVLTMDEARELRSILERGKDREGGTVVDTSLEARLGFSLEMTGVKLKKGR